MFVAVGHYTACNVIVLLDVSYCNTFQVTGIFFRTHGKVFLEEAVEMVQAAIRGGIVYCYCTAVTSDNHNTACI